MNKKLTEDQSKIDLVARLVKDGAIDFADAIKLLEVEVAKEYIPYPIWRNPYPIYPQWQHPLWGTTSAAISGTLINNGCTTLTTADKVSTGTVQVDPFKSGVPFTYTGN